ncbi:MAG TPA: phosphotransferase [Rhodopila sp.]|uniref:aminoglycoside phosphotransferase family protein n=1 Tax=Rhodopila sp. TaxID=2480087 RepID=UPI002B83E8E8|nr:phosphotransferase [Rhodopila sp.]HVY16920.1 phosphotransferase [Rhodopila sp.]
MTRDAQIAAFLARHGATLADTEPLAQDASFRRYLRVRRPIRAVLMDAPPPEDVRPFLQIARHLYAQGLTVPEILDADPDIGLVLEADFGDALLSTLLDAGEPAEPLLNRAVDALVQWQRAEPPPGVPAWDHVPMTATALGTLFDWWWPARYGAPAPAGARADVEAGLTEMLRPVAEGPRCGVHRDWFAGNLLSLPDGGVGIIDFQTAAIGHPAYDLMSLLQDARRDIPERAAASAFARYLAARPDLDPEAFKAAYQACAAQRHLRVAGQWVRLALRDHRPQYLAYGPRTWRLLRDALAQPAAAPLAAALDRWIPAADRGNPPGLAT